MEHVPEPDPGDQEAGETSRDDPSHAALPFTIVAVPELDAHALRPDGNVAGECDPSRFDGVLDPSTLQALVLIGVADDAVLIASARRGDPSRDTAHDRPASGSQPMSLSMEIKNGWRARAAASTTGADDGPNASFSAGSADAGSPGARGDVRAGSHTDGHADANVGDGSAQTTARETGGDRRTGDGRKHRRKRQLISARVDPLLVDDLEKLADEIGVSRSSLLRYALEVVASMLTQLLDPETLARLAERARNDRPTQDGRARHGDRK